MPKSSARGFTSLEAAIDRWAHARLARLQQPKQRPTDERRTNQPSAQPGGTESISRWRRGLIEFTVFVVKQAWACVFGALMLTAIVATALWYPANAAIHRNDALVIIAVLIQIGMLVFRLETARELWVVVLFHLVGTGMEVFKTSVGSWNYAPGGVLHIGAVPLFTGFMYASVGSYMVRVFRLFSLQFSHYPPRWITAVLGALIYLNFFTHHFIFDARWVLLIGVVMLYFRCWMYFRNHVLQPWRRMPILASFAGVAVFIWIAENIGTGAGAWLYPNQDDGWQLVSAQKIVSWFLLMMISVVLVTFVYRPEKVTRTST